MIAFFDEEKKIGLCAVRTKLVFYATLQHSLALFRRSPRFHWFTVIKQQISCTNSPYSSIRA